MILYICLFCLLLTVFLFFFKQKTAYEMRISDWSSDVCSSDLVFAAPRPDLLPHLDLVRSYGFPSGHAAGNMIFFGALAMLAGRRSGYVGMGLAIALIGISRVWLGVHWPSDVLAGWIEGLGWLALCGLWLPAGRGGRAGGSGRAGR